MWPIVNDNDAERLAVQRFIEAILHDAIYMADITAEFLKAQGYRPSRKKVDTQGLLLKVEPSKMSPVILRAHGFLLNLAATLRLATWERAGLRSELPPDLPTVDEAFQRLVPPEASQEPESGLVIPELAMQV